MALKSTIEQLAHQLTAGILDAIRSAPLEELLGDARAPKRAAPGRSAAAPAPARPVPAPKRGKGGRLARRSSGDIDQVVSAIVGALKSSKTGLRSEQLQAALKLDKREIVRPISQALSAKKIRKTGQKRATTYFAR